MIKTFYIDNPSGSVANVLLVKKWLSLNKDAVKSNGVTNFGCLWISAKIESIEKMIDWVTQHTHSIVEVLDEDAKIVASTHPIEPERGDPHYVGEYLCLVETADPQNLGKTRRKWHVCYWDSTWISAPGPVKRWLHLPRHF